MVRREVVKTLERLRRFLQPILLPQQVCVGVEAIGEERLHRQRGVEIGERVVVAPQRLQRAAAAVIGLGEIGPCRQHLVEARRGLGKAPQLHEHGGAAEPGVGVGGIEGKRALETFRRRREPF